MIIKLSNGRELPVEMHKTRMVQKIFLIPAEERLKAIEDAGYNTFQLRNKYIFLDMLTDSGVNAMSDNQFAGFYMHKCIDARIAFNSKSFGNLFHPLFCKIRKPIDIGIKFHHPFPDFLNTQKPLFAHLVQPLSHP